MKLEVYNIKVANKDNNNVSNKLKCVLWDSKKETSKNGFKTNSIKRKTQSPKTTVNCYTSVNATASSDVNSAVTIFF